MIFAAIGFVVCFAIGIAAIPAYVYLLKAPGLGGVIGQGSFILGQLANGGTQAYWRDDGTVAFRPFDRETMRVYNREAEEWQNVEGTPTVYRLAWGDLIFDEAAENAPTEAIVNPDDASEVLRGAANPDNKPGLRTGFDGEPHLLREKRGGFALGTAADAAKGAIIHWPRYLQQMGRSGTAMLSRAEEHAMMLHGGDSNRRGGKFMIILLLIGFCVVFGMTWGALLVM